MNNMVALTLKAGAELDGVIRQRGWFGQYAELEVRDTVDRAIAASGKTRVSRKALRGMLAETLCPDSTSLGCYPLMYYFGNDILCGECARAEYVSAGHYGSGFIHEEGPDMFCDECNKAVASSCGDPNEED